ncbi:NADH pyrophosphatase [Paramarasmius palmivorus]|uniref:NAD(+) diphosphatase n=1 Tax=Paramarasmius palmivorus TaxID=297713 RepID=A0AAW0CE09_9AGAR
MAKAQDKHVNVYAGSPLNRLGWLRTSSGFLNAIVASPRSRWILFKTGQPLVHADPKSGSKLTYLSTSSVLPLLGDRPFFGQGQTTGQPPSHEHSTSHTNALQASRHRGVPLVFLGVHEKGERVLPEKEVGAALKEGGEGAVQEFLDKDGSTPYFALDVDDRDLTIGEGKGAVLSQILDNIAKELGSGEQSKLEWVDPRAAVANMDRIEAGIFAEARTLVDWNMRNKTGEKILLGRNRRFPPKLYSALAGFLEPAETFEDCVVREMWEEVGVKVWGIQYHSGQPWPYPANLMLGWYARGDSNEEIRLDLDNELEGKQHLSTRDAVSLRDILDARWFTRNEVLSILGHETGTKMDSKTFSEKMEEEGQASKEATSAKSPKEPDFRVPPDSAMAGVLIRDWAEGRIKFDSEDSQ